MALSTIKTAVAARIAAATSTTPNVELGILKVLGKKLNLNTSNIAAISSTKSDTATQSTELKDLLLLTQGISDYYGNSYVGELRTFNTGVTDITMDDGSRWLRFGTYETNPTKWDNRYWPYALVTAAGVNTGWSQKSGNLVPSDREIVVLNSGKKIAFPLNTSIGSVVAFTSPTVAPTTLKSAAAMYIDYCYDESTDTLWLLQNSGAGLTKITANGTVVTEIAAATYAGSANTTAKSIHAKNGKIYIGLQQLVRTSPDNGVTWASYTNTGLTSSFIIGLGYNPTNNTLFAVAQAGGGQQIETGGVFTYFCSVAGASWTAVADPQGSTYWVRGLLLSVHSLGRYVLFNQSYSVYDGSYFSYNILKLFDTETRTLTVFYTNSYEIAFKTTRLIRILGTNKVVFYTYDNYSAQNIIQLLDFDAGTTGVGSSSFNSWAVSFPGSSSKAAFSGYVEGGVLYFFNVQSPTNYFEKLPLVGSANVTGSSHVRIS